MIYDPRRAALDLRQRIIDSMMPEERARAGDDSGYTVEMIKEKEREMPGRQKTTPAQEE